MPEPLSVSVCVGKAVPTTILADSMDVCVTRSGVGNTALMLFVIDAHVSVIVPVAAAATTGVSVNVTFDVSDAVVPVPDATVPDDAVMTHAVPLASTELVVAVTLVAVPTTSVEDEKLAVVGNR